MLIKFETKSSTVKGLSFHSKRSWILASLQNGLIQLWDYQREVLIECFHGHSGPVRGVHFHPYQPLFVSGGDDCQIKVWSHETRKCLFTLLGHRDYIRTVQFHHESPWICSASDDQTIRIWNYQTRDCISVLFGHTHYVMCASFHPMKDLLASASLDSTIRIWDLGPLRKKTVSPQGSLGMIEDKVFMKFEIEGHQRGVNWVSFHPNFGWILSGGYDRVIKLWRLTDTGVCEIDSLSGHEKNISCVIFHPKKGLIISNSEDKTIRFFNMSNPVMIKPFQREKDRFWILSVHPDLNLFAAGHDSGLMVFKIERERPAYFLSLETNQLFSVKDRLLRVYNTVEGKQIKIVNLRRPYCIISNEINPIALSCNEGGKEILLSYHNREEEYEFFEMYTLPLDKSSSGTNSTAFAEAIDNRSTGGTATFTASNKFVIFNKTSNEIMIQNVRDHVVEKYTLPVVTNFIYYAGEQNILCRNGEGVSIFNLSGNQLAEIGRLSTPSKVKYVSWSKDMKYLALISKTSVILARNELEQCCTVLDAVRIKSGAWDESEEGVFIYNTLTHIKYCLVNGEKGTVRTLDEPVYIIRVVGSRVYCLGRDENMRIIKIENSEYVFKLALMRNKHKKVVSMVNNSKLCGQAIISYLAEKGLDKIDLDLVRDEKIRSDLALRIGNLEIAFNSAKKINEKDYWYRLGTEALRQGNVSVVEYSYQQTKNLERLSFLYLITGNLDKLSKMVKQAEIKNDVMSQFHNVMYLGDIKARVQILEKSGLISLAYLTALTHGMKEKAGRLATHMGENVPVPPRSDRYGSLLVPPLPITCSENWPLLRMAQEDKKLGFGNGEEEEATELDGKNEESTEEMEASRDKRNGENRWVMEGLQLEAPKLEFTIPELGECISTAWYKQSYIVAHYAAAGKIESAKSFLKRQIGISNFAPLKQLFIGLYIGSYTYVNSNVHVPSIPIPLQNPNYKNEPFLITKFAQLNQKLEEAYEFFAIRKLNESLKLFLNILHTIPLVKVDTRKEVDEMKEMIGIAREYSLGLKMEMKRMEITDDLVRQQELAGYFANCKLQRVHLGIAVNHAMRVCYNNRNYKTAAYFARVLLENGPDETQDRNAMTVINFQGGSNKGDENELKVDFRNPNFRVCGLSFEPIYEGERSLVCSYCGAHFKMEFNKKVCGVCEIGAVGGKRLGFVCSPSQYGK